MSKQAKVTICPDYRIGKVEDRIYGGYVEPIRNFVLGGLYNPKHPAADEFGFRTDLLQAIREFGMPAIRMPGGNFVSGWEWRDSIGPKENRKTRLDLSLRQYEPNLVGHDEYIEWARRAGVEPLYTVNLGTGDINSAVEIIEYSNHPGGTYWSDLRKKNGHAEPYGIKVWYLGNEMDGPWQIGSWEKNPRGYGVLAHETSKAMKWVDPSIETVACASSSPYNHTYPQWDIDVLEQCYETVDYISVHHYHQAPIGNIPAYLAASCAFEDYIRTEIAVCDYMKAKLRSDKTMMLSFDEYGSMMRPNGKTYTGRAGKIPSEHHTHSQMDRPFMRIEPDKRAETFIGIHRHQMLSALTSASVIMTFLRHADRIKIGCMTGSLMGAISFDNNHVWKSATYYPYYLMAKYGRGTAIMPAVDGPKFDVEGIKIDEVNQNMPYEDVQAIEAAAVYNEEKSEVSIFLLNRDVEDNIQINLDVSGFEGYKLIEHIELYTSDLEATNSFDRPDSIEPSVNKDTKMDNGKVTVNAKKLSWNMIRLGL